MAKSDAYREKIEKAIIQAIVDASFDPTTNTTALLTGEVVDACLSTIAVMASASEVSSSPTRLREFATECAKAIRAQTAAMRQLRKRGITPFKEIVPVEGLH